MSESDNFISLVYTGIYTVIFLDIFMDFFLDICSFGGVSNLRDLSRKLGP